MNLLISKTSSLTTQKSEKILTHSKTKRYEYLIQPNDSTLELQIIKLSRLGKMLCDLATFFNQNELFIYYLGYFSKGMIVKNPQEKLALPITQDIAQPILNPEHARSNTSVLSSSKDILFFSHLPNQDRSLDNKTLLVGCEVIQGVGDWVNVIQFSRFFKEKYQNIQLLLGLTFVEDNAPCALQIKQFMDEEKKKPLSERLFSKVFIECSFIQRTMGLCKGNQEAALDSNMNILCAESEPLETVGKIDLLVEIATSVFDSSSSKLSHFFYKNIDQIPVISCAEHGSRYRESRTLKNDFKKMTPIIANMGVREANKDIGLRLYDFDLHPTSRASFLKNLNDNTQLFPVRVDIGKPGHLLSVAYLQDQHSTETFICTSIKLLLSLSHTNKSIHGMDLFTSKKFFDLQKFLLFLNNDPDLSLKIKNNSLEVVHLTPENIRQTSKIQSSPTHLVIRIFTGFQLDDENYHLCYKFSDLISGFSGDDSCCKVLSAKAIPFHGYPRWKSAFHFDLIELSLSLNLKLLGKYFLLFSNMDQNQADRYINDQAAKPLLEEIYKDCFFSTGGNQHLIKTDLIDFLVSHYPKISAEYEQFRTHLSLKYHFWKNLPTHFQSIPFPSQNPSQ